MFRQWKLQQNPIDFWIVVEFVNFTEQILFRNIIWEFVIKREDPNLVTFLPFHFNIRARRGMIADENKGKAWFSVFEVRNSSFDMREYLVSDGCTVYYAHSCFTIVGCRGPFEARM